ncbi:MAG TPA: glycosyltransferase family 2 protein [Methylomirabilota bacterium]|nr:glycosyltransferase family 2 protein [Methylomirabilota bacterium]
MNRLSACVITLNEEKNLPRLLASLSGVADEIVIVDAGSSDRTEQIAHEHHTVLLKRAWTNYAEQKNFAASSASNEWILSLDADEELSCELKNSLLEWKTMMPEFAVYEMARRAWYLGGWVRHSGWYPDFQRRLYRRDAAQFSGIVHEALRYEGKPGRMKGDLLHYTVETFAEHAEKVERYAALAGRQLFLDGKRSWRPALWFAVPWSWFQNFFLRAGFLDGYRGARIAQMAARAVRLKYRELGRLVATAATQDHP